ncbi:cell division protein SepF [Carnobacteriaceae bacterium zg-ZUI252]|nr:cell division protein SepF [Carnobacteriaceae bacterium zg-ZUI252]QTU82694.1 cell division protein SepF [Carnobacteriaceae bacterium zg-C25]
MGIFDNFKGMLSASDEQNEYEELTQNYYEDGATPVVTSTTRPNVKAVPSRAVVNICEPRVYSEVEDMATLLMDKQVIIVNFKRMDKAQAGRVIDYLTGIIFAVNGSVQKLQNEIFLFTPADITIAGVLDGNEDQNVTDYLDMV